MVTNQQASVPSLPSLPSSDSPESYEAANVHSVYASIAPHFSATRHKPWPLVSQFLLSLPPGSLGLDVGCGNGKYLPVNPALHILASDRSRELLVLAADPPVGVAGGKGQEEKKEVDGLEGGNELAERRFKPAQLAEADTLNLPYRSSGADFVICIAVIHHLSTRPRRIAAITEMLRCLRPPSSSSSPPVSSLAAPNTPSSAGQCLIYVWAFEQTATSRRTWTEQDQMVPWVLRKKGVPQSEQTTYQRYYHVYKEGELEEDVAEAGGVVLERGYERDNWWVICARSS